MGMEALRSGGWDAPVWGLGRAGFGDGTHRFGGWGGALHDSQGVALGCHVLPRWGRNRSRASPPNPGQPVHNLHCFDADQAAAGALISRRAKFGAGVGSRARYAVGQAACSPIAGLDLTRSWRLVTQPDAQRLSSEGSAMRSLRPNAVGGAFLRRSPGSVLPRSASPAARDLGCLAHKGRMDSDAILKTS